PRQALLLRALNAIQHLYFEAGFRVALLASEIRQAPNEGDIVGAKSGPGASSSRLRAQQFLRDNEVIFVDVRLLRKGDFRWFLVCALDQTNGGVQRQQIGQVLLCPAEIGL